MDGEARDRVSGGVPEDGTVVERLELRGLKCPLPALRAQKALLQLRPGAILEVCADDPLAPLDITHLCRSGGHALLATQAMDAGAFRFTIRRGV